MPEMMPHPDGLNAPPASDLPSTRVGRDETRAKRDASKRPHRGIDEDAGQPLAARPTDDSSPSPPLQQPPHRTPAEPVAGGGFNLPDLPAWQFLLNIRNFI